MLDTFEPLTESEAQPELWLNRELWHAMLSHLRQALPNEGVCLLATVPVSGTARETRRAVHMFPGTNIEHSPTRFTMDPREVAAALREMAEQGWTLGVIAHSHPQGSPTLSATDLREQYYPEAFNLIVSFKQTTPEVRAWTVRTTTGTTGVVPVRIVLE